MSSGSDSKTCTRCGRELPLSAFELRVYKSFKRYTTVDGEERVYPGTERYFLARCNECLAEIEAAKQAELADRERRRAERQARKEAKEAEKERRRAEREERRQARKEAKEEERFLREIGALPPKPNKLRPTGPTKVCNRCGEEKKAEEFAWRNKAMGSRRPRCRACEVIDRREAKARRGDELRESNREAQRRYRERWSAADRRANLIQRRAYQRATVELREAHRAEFDRLYAEAKELESTIYDEEHE